MSFNISAEQSYAYAEMLEILSFISKKFVNKIPTKMMNIFETYASKTYENHLNKYEPLESQNISKKTAALIGVVALKYWCETDEELTCLKEIISENDKLAKKQKEELYSPDKIFSSSKEEFPSEDIISSTEDSSITNESIETESIESQTVELVDYSKIPWYKKIFLPFKKIKHKKNNNKTKNPT